MQLSEILIATPQPHDPVQVEDARHKAEALRAAIASGSPFPDIAKANSQGPTASNGGRMGVFYRGDLAPSLENVVFSMRLGEVSEVIQTKQGFVIFQVTGKAGPEVQNDSHLEVLNAPMTAELQGYLEEMKKKIRQHWYALIPTAALAPEKKQGTVIVGVEVLRDGSIGKVKILSSAGDPALDQAALDAIRESSPLPPLAAFTKSDHLVLRSRFEYNSEKSPKTQN